MACSDSTPANPGDDSGATTDAPATGDDAAIDAPITPTPDSSTDAPTTPGDAQADSPISLDGALDASLDAAHD